MEGTLKRLFEGIGYPEGISDPRFATHEARLANIDALDALIQEHLAQLTMDEALQFFAERDITAGPICDIRDLVGHPYIQERELLVSTRTPDGQEVPVHAAPYRINGQRPPIRRDAPGIGQDNARWIRQPQEEKA
jgi:formyl-CoA transferase